MPKEKELAEADLLLMPEGWEGELEPGFSSDLMFVVQLRDGRPAKLQRLEGPRRPADVTASLGAGEALVPARVELPDGSMLDVRFARGGAIWERAKHHVFLPATEDFEAPEDVASKLATPGFSLLASEPLLGRTVPVPVPRTETLECTGPPAHTITVPWGLHACLIHPEAKTERV
jgi:hypothetical protein